MGDIVSEPRHASNLVFSIWFDASSSADRDRIREHFTARAKNPIYLTYDVKANNSTLTNNIEAHLAGLVEIKRYAFNRSKAKIEAVVREAVQVYGYYHPEVKIYLDDEADYDNPLVHIEVDRGEPVKIGELTLDYGVSDEILEEVKACEEKNKIFKGGKFNHINYENFKTDVLSTLLSRGYIKAKIASSQVFVYKDEKIADISLSIIPGQRFKIASITYEGFEESHNVAKKMNHIKEGDYYDTQRQAELSQNLYQSGYFQVADVKVDDKAAVGDTVPMNIHLEPRPSTIIDLGVGFSTDEGPRIQMTEKNPWINDLGHSFNSSGKVSAKNAYFRGNYVIPKDDPINDFYQISPTYDHKDNNDTLYDSFVISGHYITRIHGTWDKDIFIEYGYDDFVQGDNKGWSSLLMPGITLSRTKLQQSADPSWGYRISITAKASLENIISRERIIYSNLVLKALMSPTVNSRLLLRFEQGALIWGTMDNIPPRLRFFTGGDNTIRGYGYEQIAPKDSTGHLQGGRYLTVGSAEIQIPIMESMRLASFFDAGVVTNSYSKDREIKVGTGLGIRYLSPVGPIRLDLGVGVSETHIPFRIHFGIGPGL